MIGELKRYGGFVLLSFFLGFFTVQGLAQSGSEEKERSETLEFEARAKAYADMREKVSAALPKLSPEATADEIARYREMLLAEVRKARAGAKAGDIFTPESSEMIRRIVALQYSGPEKSKLLKEIFEAETAGVPMSVNAEYPKSKEQLDTPPKLLMALPQLPKQLRYRFVGRNILLVDRENGMIVDVMENAI